MKKVKSNKKLQLNKETIAQLNNEKLGTIYGGTAPTTVGCPTHVQGCDTVALSCAGYTCASWECTRPINCM